MSLVRALVEIQLLVDHQHIRLNDTTEQRVPVVLVQILAKILLSQNIDGSWGLEQCPETTAYAVLALLAFDSLPYIQVLGKEIQQALERGEAALSSQKELWTKPNALWLNTTAYASSLTSKAYSIAITQMLIERRSRGTQSDMSSLAAEVLKFSKVFSSMDHLSKQPLFMINATMLEGLFYGPILQAKRTDVFPQTDTTSKDKYLHYIPLTVILAGTVSELFLSPEYLEDMMVLSMWIFLVDEYMESNVIKFSATQMATFRQRLEAIHPENGDIESDPSFEGLFQTSQRDDSAEGLPPDQSNNDVETAVSIFMLFAKNVMNYRYIADASPLELLDELLDLCFETKNYLLYHVTQLEDNQRFSRQEHYGNKNTQFNTPRAPYHTWAHTVGAGHVSDPFSFAFMTCRLSGSIQHGTSCFGTVKQKLMAYKMNSHIGSFCRIYNDYGSVGRDRYEHNINSVNFPEFFPLAEDDRVNVETEAKKSLLKAGVYERKCAMEIAEELYKDLEAEGKDGKDIADALRIYIGTCEQLFDMYLTKDVTNRVK
jgi:hypothetical protein